MRILLIIVFALFKNVSMGQRIEINAKGLNIITIDSYIDKIKITKLTPIKYYVNDEQIRTWFEDYFDYYFIDSDTMFIEKVGIIKEIFVATNKSKEVKGIFIFLEEPNKQLLPLMNEIFNDAKLKSETSIDNEYMHGKIFWKKNEVSAFLDKTKKSKIIKISITSVGIEEKTPGINIDQK